MPAGLGPAPTPANLAAGKHFVHQDGREVFKRRAPYGRSVARVLAQLGLSGDDIDYLVPHQANRRIIEPTAKRLGIGLDRVVINIDRVANTTAATIPLAMADAFDDGRLQPGSRVMLAAFGGGFSWGACYLTFGRTPDQDESET